MSNATLAQLHRRFSLNLLIQGAATHTFLTAHHVVREELESLQAGLVARYDQLAVSLLLNHWIGDLNVLLGRSGAFWRRLRRTGEPFAGHRLLCEHGRELSAAAYRHAVARAREKSVATTPGVHYAQGGWLFMKTLREEEPLKEPLTEVGLLAASRIWGVDATRLEAELTFDVDLGDIPEPKSRTGQVLRWGAVGYSGVLRDDTGALYVSAKAATWVLLAHELVKGVAELVCLHGMAGMTDADYSEATGEADRIEYEPWLMQAGSELWRRWLAAVPPGRSIAEQLMHVAKLPAAELERLLTAVVKDPDEAKRLNVEA